MSNSMAFNFKVYFQVLYEVQAIVHLNEMKILSLLNHLCHTMTVHSDHVCKVKNT